MAPDREYGPARLVIDIAEAAGDWSGGDVDAAIGPVPAALAARLPAAAGVVALALADDALVRDLNARFRGLDKPTNVLSFPFGEASGPDMPLGDVVVALETVRREAESERKPLRNHVTHLVVHGILHLLGYDHETVADAEVMERLETAILADLGIEDPYVDTVVVADGRTR